MIRLPLELLPLTKTATPTLPNQKKKITLVDTVEYEGLKKGQSYKLIGTLMDQESGKPIEIDGKPVTAETTFKPKKIFWFCKSDLYVQCLFSEGQNNRSI